MTRKNNKAAGQRKSKPQHIHFFHKNLHDRVSTNFNKFNKTGYVKSSDFRAETSLDKSAHYSGKNDFTLSSYGKICDLHIVPYSFMMLKEFNPKDPQNMIHEFLSNIKSYYGSGFGEEYINRLISGSVSVLQAIFFPGCFVFVEV